MTASETVPKGLTVASPSLLLARRAVLRGTAGIALGAVSQPMAHAAGIPVPSAVASQPIPPGFVRIPLWPYGMPGESGPAMHDEIIARIPSRGPEDVVFTRVGEPALIALRPAKANGAVLLFVPGGGYQRVAVGLEGYAISRRFAAMGYTCFNLIYRLPWGNWKARSEAPLQDAQRALRMVRALAPTYGCSPERVGVVGFSAGGHLAGWLATRETPAYPRQDAIDDHPLHAAFAGLLYPVVTMEGSATHRGSRDNLLGPTPSADQLREHSIQIQLGAATPPMFLAHALDDAAVAPENSMTLFTALREKRIAAECHWFESGGHGFGLTAPGTAPALWPELLAAFAARHGA